MNELPPNPESEPKSLSRQVADLLCSEAYGTNFGFDQTTCEEVANMPFEEAFETAYSYLTQAGADADAALAPWLEQQPESNGN